MARGSGRLRGGVLTIRHPRELTFRLKQEIANLWLWTSPPPAGFKQSSPLPGLPGPTGIADCLRGGAFAREVERLADLVIEHRFPVFGHILDTGRHIEWRRDYMHGRTSGLQYFRRVPYLDFSRVGDHKWVWELNRHQHLVLLAQAFRLTNRRDFAQEIGGELESWWQDNPWMRGINWTSALEVAFRALSLLWVIHLASDALEPGVRRLLWESIYRHGCYLERNLSVYFSPNTHLLGEAVALHALGALLSALPHSERWRNVAGSIVAQQILTQVRDDGSHFEQSAYYHVYALDMFLFHYLIARTTDEYGRRLLQMAEYLHALMGPSGQLPALGDDDGGRFFHPYGLRLRFGRATLATCGAVFDRPEWIERPEDLDEQAVWWLGPQVQAAGTAPAKRESRLFRQAGIAVLNAAGLHVVVDVGPFGPGSAGHSHSDTLSITVRVDDSDILIDPGTFTYVSDPAERQRFRSSAAHNTIRVDQADQAVPEGPFRWAGKPEVTLLDWATKPDCDVVEAVCRYRNVAHRRKVLLLKHERRLEIRDAVDGPAGEHSIEQFWHFGCSAERESETCFRIGNCRLTVSPGSEVEMFQGGEYGWRSPVFGSKAEAQVLRVFRRSSLPVQLGACFDLPA